MNCNLLLLYLQVHVYVLIIKKEHFFENMTSSALEKQTYEQKRSTDDVRWGDFTSYKIEYAFDQLPLMSGYGSQSRLRRGVMDLSPVFVICLLNCEGQFNHYHSVD